MHLRLLGQDATLEVEWRRGISPAQAFAERYRLVYGYEPPPQPVEVESLRVIASTRPGVVAVASEPTILQQPPRGRLFVPGPYHRVPVFDRRDLPPGAVLAGPALILERHSATVVASGWELGVDGARSLVLTSKEAGDAA
jgi:5-oxoprolinase (ATP-hydrolysing)